MALKAGLASTKGREVCCLFHYGNLLAGKAFEREETHSHIYLGGGKVVIQFYSNIFYSKMITNQYDVILVMICTEIKTISYFFVSNFLNSILIFVR